MTTMTTARRNFGRWWVLTIAVTDSLYGSAYLLGGPAATPALLLMERVAPMRVWGAGLVLVGLLFFGRQYLYAGTLGAAIWAMLAYTAGITLVTGTSVAAGGVFLTAGVATLHGLISWAVLAGYTSDEER